MAKEFPKVRNFRMHRLKMCKDLFVYYIDRKFRVFIREKNPFDTEL